MNKTINYYNHAFESLSKYRKILLELNNSKKYFYCNGDLDDNNIHVDHFIPWSYVYDDELWNLVLSCTLCNLKKSDYLPSENNLIKIQNRNEKFNLVQVNKDISEYYHNCKKAGFLLLN